MARGYASDLRKERNQYAVKGAYMPILAGFAVPHPPMIVPEIGRGSEKQITETTESYKRVAARIAKLEPDTIIITSPHATMYRDYFHISPGASTIGSFAAFSAPSVSFYEKYDEELAEKITLLSAMGGFPAGTAGEKNRQLDHGTMVPLYFIRKVYKKGRILRIGLSGLSLSDHYRFGKFIKKAVEELDRKVVFVASGDLSHKLQEYGPYGFAKEGPEYDERVMDVLGRGAFPELLDFDEEFLDAAAECGHRSFAIMAGALDGTEIKARAYSHQDVTGVGYGICGFYPVNEESEDDFEEEMDEYVKLAKYTVEEYVKTGKRPHVPEDTPEELLSSRAGVFVSIHKKNGDLRGCIGTIAPWEINIAEEIISNGISASTRDPRFEAIKPEELDDLEINVDVLSPAEDISSMDELDVKRYGVIVSCGNRRGLLLPDLEGVDSVEQQVMIAMKKGGIYPGEKYKLQRFEVVRHK